MKGLPIVIHLLHDSSTKTTSRHSILLGTRDMMRHHARVVALPSTAADRTNLPDPSISVQTGDM